jgi:hypothetical protein
MAILRILVSVSLCGRPRSVAGRTKDLLPRHEVDFTVQIASFSHEAFLAEKPRFQPHKTVFYYF